MNYASVRTCDVANGEGVRVSLFVSGCTHHCKGCFNDGLWDFGAGRPFTEETENLILDAVSKGWVSGLSLLGGDPMMPSNQLGVIGLVRRFRERFGAGKTIWCYTGCLLEGLESPSSPWHTEVTDELLGKIDVLVDGPYMEALRDPSLAYRGSSNQRIIRLKDVRDITNYFG